MDNLFFILILIAIYLIAAIPTGVVLSRLMGSGFWSPRASRTRLIGVTPSW